MHRSRGLKARWIVLPALLLLGACTNPFADDAPSFRDILAAGWLEDEEPLPVMPIYCYDTIGAPDCHQAPLVDEGGRLRGFEGPPPPAATVP